MINPIKTVLSKLSEVLAAAPNGFIITIILVIGLAAFSVLKRFD